MLLSIHQKELLQPKIQSQSTKIQSQSIDLLGVARGVVGSFLPLKSRWPCPRCRPPVLHQHQADPRDIVLSRHLVPIVSIHICVKGDTVVL